MKTCIFMGELSRSYPFMIKGRITAKIELSLLCHFWLVLQRLFCCIVWMQDPLEILLCMPFSNLFSRVAGNDWIFSNMSKVNILWRNSVVFYFCEHLRHLLGWLQSWNSIVSISLKIKMASPLWLLCVHMYVRSLLGHVYNLRYQHYTVYHAILIEDLASKNLQRTSAVIHPAATDQLATLCIGVVRENPS